MKPGIRLKPTRENKRIILWALTGLAFFWLLCSVATAKEKGFPVAVTDMDGISLNIDSPPQRIISLSASTTELLFSMGAGDRIIGVTDDCNYPPEARKKETMGGMFLDFEKIVTSRPDLVVVEGTLRSRESVKLRRLGVPVLVVRSDNYEDFLQSFGIIGKALGCAMDARQMAMELDRRIKSIMDGMEESRQHRPEVFVEIWDRPLITAGDGTFINFVVGSAGGRNIFSDTSGYPQVNPESLILRDPEVIILTTSKVEEITTNRLYRSLRAVRFNRVHRINPDILARPTTRLYHACRILNRWFYPQTDQAGPQDKY